MTNLLNKSNHPVEVKKVKVRIWTLRSEIEAAIENKLQNSEGADSSDLDISDIQTFYNTHIPGELEEEILEEESETKDEEVAKLTEEVLTDSESGDSDKKTEDKPAVFQRQIPSDSHVFSGEVLLSDIHMDKLMLFTNKSFLQGQNIIVQFLITKPFRISGEVAKTLNFSRNSKIIKEEKLDQRVQVRCNLLFPEERSNLREFLKSIEPSIPTAPKKQKAVSESEEDDDFDDLGL